MPIGTIINTVAVIVGSLIGVFLHQSFPDRIKLIIFDVFGLTTIALAIQMVLKMENFLIVVFSVLIGGILGEVVKLEEYLEKVGEIVRRRVKSKNTRFAEGMVAAFILFCVGPMTILGTLNEGLRGDRSLILTKALLDGFASVVFATTYGIGVLFSAIPLFFYQSTLTLVASNLQPFLSQSVINQLTAAGGILILGLGINLLELKKIKVANLLPSLVIVVALTLIFT